MKLDLDWTWKDISRLKMKKKILEVELIYLTSQFSNWCVVKKWNMIKRQVKSSNDYRINYRQLLMSLIHILVLFLLYVMEYISIRINFYLQSHTWKNFPNILFILTFLIEMFSPSEIYFTCGLKYGCSQLLLQHCLWNPSYSHCPFSLIKYIYTSVHVS